MVLLAMTTESSRDPTHYFARARRLDLARGGAVDPAHLHASADEFFPLPEDDLVFWPCRDKAEKFIYPGDLEATPIVL